VKPRLSSISPVAPLLHQQIKVVLEKGLSDEQGEELQQMVNQQVCVHHVLSEPPFLKVLRAPFAGFHHQAEENAGMAMIFTLGALLYFFLFACSDLNRYLGIS
jgi:hypothetical protein